MNCNFCGAALPADAQSCDVCGKPVTKLDRTIPAAPQAELEQNAFETPGGEREEAMRPPAQRDQVSAQAQALPQPQPDTDEPPAPEPEKPAKRRIATQKNLRHTRGVLLGYGLFILCFLSVYLLFAGLHLRQATQAESGAAFAAQLRNGSVQLNRQELAEWAASEINRGTGTLKVSPEAIRAVLMQPAFQSALAEQAGKLLQSVVYGQAYQPPTGAQVEQLFRQNSATIEQVLGYRLTISDYAAISHYFDQNQLKLSYQNTSAHIGQLATVLSILFFAVLFFACTVGFGFLRKSASDAFVFGGVSFAAGASALHCTAGLSVFLELLPAQFSMETALARFLMGLPAASTMAAFGFGICLALVGLLIRLTKKLEARRRRKRRYRVAYN